MDYECESTARVSRRGSSAVIELDIAYTDRHGPSAFAARASRRMSEMMSPRDSKVRDEMSELGETLEHLTSEFGKPYAIPVDEDGCPDKPPDMKVYRNSYLKWLSHTYREAIHPVSYRYVTLNFRIMRRNAGMYVGFLLSQKKIPRSDLYKARYLPIWTHCIRVRMRASVKIGIIFHGLKSRLGVCSVQGIHFCVDGFYGIEAFGDAFGNVGAGICPWMELSSNGSPKSLRLKDSDNIYVSVATESMEELVEMRKLRAARRPSMASAVTMNQKKLQLNTDQLEPGQDLMPLRASTQEPKRKSDKAPTLQPLTGILKNSMAS